MFLCGFKLRWRILVVIQLREFRYRSNQPPVGQVGVWLCFCNIWRCVVIVVRLNMRLSVGFDAQVCATYLRSCIGEFGRRRRTSEDDCQKNIPGGEPAWRLEAGLIVISAPTYLARLLNSQKVQLWRRWRGRRETGPTAWPLGLSLTLSMGFPLTGFPFSTTAIAAVGECVSFAS